MGLTRNSLVKVTAALSIQLLAMAVLALSQLSVSRTTAEGAYLLVYAKTAIDLTAGALTAGLPQITAVGLSSGTLSPLQANVLINRYLSVVLALLVPTVIPLTLLSESPGYTAGIVAAAFSRAAYNLMRGKMLAEATVFRFSITESIQTVCLAGCNLAFVCTFPQLAPAAIMVACLVGLAMSDPCGVVIPSREESGQCILQWRFIIGLLRGSCFVYLNSLATLFATWYVLSTTNTDSMRQDASDAALTILWLSYVTLPVNLLQPILLKRWSRSRVPSVLFEQIQLKWAIVGISLLAYCLVQYIAPALFAMDTFLSFARIPDAPSLLLLSGSALYGRLNTTVALSRGVPAVLLPAAAIRVLMVLASPALGSAFGAETLCGPTGSLIISELAFCLSLSLTLHLSR